VPRDLEKRVLEVLEKALRRHVYIGPTPGWLMRPGRLECGTRWRTVRLIYRQLTNGREVSDEMPMREWREVDGLFGGRGIPWRIVEVDESQHFNEFRALTLGKYPKDVPLGFPKGAWLAESRRRRARAGGGWAKPRPPLFPMAGGRHRQRAFRDALADLLPSVHDYAPTLRIAHFEVEPWIWQRGAIVRLGDLVMERIQGA